MKRLLMMLPFVLFVGQAAAIERHDMSKMTCEQVQSALKTEGKAILRSPSSRIPGMMKYEKYVSNRSSCGSPPSWAMSTRVKTSDSQSCLVYRCVSITRSTPRY
jgi:hypothetical protein